MDPDLARKLFYEGATLIVLDMQQGTEFGIDYNSWTVGPKFKGVKMIPPGFHFIFYSAVSKTKETAPRTGFFHFFKRTEVFTIDLYKTVRELMVCRWDKSLEVISRNDISPEDKDSLHKNLVDLDSSLGPYPYESLKKWISLSNHITEDIVSRVQPLNGYVSSVTQCLPDDSEKLQENPNVEPERTIENEGAQLFAGVGLFSLECKKSSDRFGIPLYSGILQAKPDSILRFHRVSRTTFPKDLTPAQVSHHCMDFSYTLEEILKKDFESANDILGELQLAFLCFVQGQVYDAFEHWKSLVRMLCSCEEAMKHRSALFSEFISVLHFQLKEVPEDFFVDIVSKSNFLTSTLQTFFSTLEQSGGSMDSSLVKKGLKFRDSVNKQFKWDFSVEPDEYAPTFVD